MSRMTAKQVRDKMAQDTTAKVQNQLDECDKAIEKSLKERQGGTYVYIYAEQEVIDNLKVRGFSTEQISNQLNDDTLIIRW